MNSNCDVRVVRFQNNDFLKRHSYPLNNSKDVNSFLSFSYFNNIEVNPVIVADNVHPLNAAYNELCELFENEHEFVSQQSVFVFLDYSIQEDVTQGKVDAFWGNDSYPLFFATMVKILAGTTLKDTLNRIKEIFKNKDDRYLIYITFEYDEIIIFFKGNKFKEYSDLIMELNFGNIDGVDNNIVDTITVCSFSKKDDVYENNYDLEQFGAHICMGTDNLAALNDFLDEFCEETKSIRLVQKCLLGRNDIAIINTQSDIKWLHLLYKKYINQKKAIITTIKLSILIDSPETKELKSSNCSMRASDFNIQNLEKSFSKIKDSYKKFCNSLQIECDEVFLRILCDIIESISYMQQNQLTDDLIICLLPQLCDFLYYLNNVFSCDIPSKKIKEETNKLCVLLNKFYYNIIVLINSTVHSSRQFIQIPHCAAPAFEMSPKLMAYYSILVRKIADVFNDEDFNCGIILAPKLVEELEVESLVLDSTDPRQFISIGISEKMFYNIKRTVAISSHEIAHYIGRDCRNRRIRNEYIIKYFLIIFLLQVDEEYCKFKYGDHTRNKGEIHINEISRVAEELKDFCFEFLYGKDLYESNLYLRNTDEIIQKLIGLFRSNHIFINKVYELLYSKNMLERYEENKGEFMADTIVQNHGKVYDGSIVSDFGSFYNYESSKFSYINAIERFSFKTNESSEEIRFLLNDYVNHVFSEAYADISMILLFDMSYDDYCSLYLNELSETFDSHSEGELIRILCVVSSLYSIGYWEDIGELNLSLSNANMNIISKGAVALKKSKIMYLEFLKENDFDITFMKLVVSYLEKCAHDLKEYLTERNDEIVEIRKLYNQANESISVSSLLEKIRILEEEYKFEICKN